MTAWTAAFATDQHSVQLMPPFVDVTTSLELTNYTGLYCSLLPDVLYNIHGQTRTVQATMGAYGIGLVNTYDMALSAITSPANSGELCAPYYVPVKFRVNNPGMINHNFATNPISLHFSVAAALNIPAFDTMVTINSGSLTIGNNYEFELMSLYDVSKIGIYNMTGWISNGLDTIHTNDTLRTTYNVLRTSLPLDEDFSGGIPSEFEAKADNTPAIWTVVSQGGGADTVVKPVFGTKMLSFVGNTGAQSTLYTHQLDLSGTVQPALSFWYFHDTVFNRDYTDVRITTDGINYNTLYSLTKYDPLYYGWKQYSMDLPSYAINQCVILAFEAMEKSTGNVTQYIDRIRIEAKKDMAVSAIILPALSACDLNNKQLKVVIRTTSNHAVDLSGAQLAVEIPGHSPFPVIVAFPHTVLPANGYDTITLPNLINLDTGNYTVRAYVTVPVDDFIGNDTAYYTVDIRPSLEVRVINFSTSTSPIDAGWSVNQRITIINTGNVPLSDLRLRLRVLVNAQPATVIDQTLTGVTIAVGDSLANFAFTESYAIPWTSVYGVLVEVMGCDSVKIKGSGYTDEYANTDDLELLRIDNPSGSGSDTVGQQINVKIVLRNNSTVHNFQDVKATIALNISDGTAVGVPYSETIPIDIPLAVDTSFTFTQAYTVPNDSVYTLTVFLSDINGNTIDYFQQNDTVRVTRRTNLSVGITDIEGTGISMSQNIPNPANGNTRIDYSLPTNGEVTFHVYTISGQELFTRVVETTSGKHSIELNTTNLASGIYFYSMEFKGQRIVKRMSVEL
jgi:hypothetical protein